MSVERTAVPTLDLSGWWDGGHDAREAIALHRVVPAVDGKGHRPGRRSAAFFHDGYADVTAAEHLAQKLGGSSGLELNGHAGREAARIGAGRP